MRRVLLQINIVKKYDEENLYYDFQCNNLEINYTHYHMKVITKQMSFAVV